MAARCRYVQHGNKTLLDVGINANGSQHHHLAYCDARDTVEKAVERRQARRSEATKKVAIVAREITARMFRPVDEQGSGFKGQLALEP